jgi:hypothetical protein
MFARESTPVIRKNKTAGLSRIHSDEKRKRERERYCAAMKQNEKKKKVFLFEMRINVCFFF